MDQYKVNNIFKLEQQEQQKKCPRCNIYKIFSDYHKSKLRKFGLQTICKSCKKIESKKYKHKWPIYKNIEELKDRTSLTIKKWIFANIKRSAKKRGIIVELTLEDIPNLPMYCPVLGIELGVRQKSFNQTYSVDRIDSTKGYIKNNIVIVSSKVNSCKSDLSFHELEKMYLFYKQFQKD